MTGRNPALGTVYKLCAVSQTPPCQVLVGLFIISFSCFGLSQISAFFGLHLLLFSMSCNRWDHKLMGVPSARPESRLPESKIHS